MLHTITLNQGVEGEVCGVLKRTVFEDLKALRTVLFVCFGRAVSNVFEETGKNNTKIKRIIYTRVRYPFCASFCKASKACFFERSHNFEIFFTV